METLNRKMQGATVGARNGGRNSITISIVPCCPDLATRLPEKDVLEGS
jgi:hypothetical protein